MVDELRADVIVVGAGSAGCAAARRLIDRGDLDVLVLKPGGEDHNPAIHDPGARRLERRTAITYHHRAGPDQSHTRRRGAMSADPRLAQFVFGYGSLLSHNRSPALASAQTARLEGYRRAWNIAMDNTVDLPGYKYYRDPTGERPRVFVTFLNLVPAAGHRVNGIVFEVTAADLRELDARERNYARIEVTERVTGASCGKVWTYLGTADARQRYENGRATGRAVVSRDYHDAVVRSFASLGADAAAEYTSTTDPPACPIRELERVDLRGAPPPKASGRRG